MEAADFINKCLQRKPANRLGLNGPNEVKQHIWLRDVDWQAVIEGKVSSTFIPGNTFNNGCDGVDSATASFEQQGD